MEDVVQDGLEYALVVMVVSHLTVVVESKQQPQFQFKVLAEEDVENIDKELHVNAL